MVIQSDLSSKHVYSSFKPLSLKVITPSLDDKHKQSGFFYNLKLNGKYGQNKDKNQYIILQYLVKIIFICSASAFFGIVVRTTFDVHISK